jgi:hypothetical protein
MGETVTVTSPTTSEFTNLDHESTDPLTSEFREQLTSVIAVI